MTETVRLDIAAAESLATEALVASRTSPANATLTARALVAAEIDGQAGHGVFRVPTYALQSRTGKVNGFVTPQVEHVAAASVRVDGQLGFAYPAVKLAEEHLVALARKHGITAAVIHRSHHFGQAGAHAERLACVGLIALVLSNTPRAMAFWPGSRRLALRARAVSEGILIPRPLYEQIRALAGGAR